MLGFEIKDSKKFIDMNSGAPIIKITDAELSLEKLHDSLSMNGRDFVAQEIGNEILSLLNGYKGL